MSGSAGLVVGRGIPSANDVAAFEVSNATQLITGNVTFQIIRSDYNRGVIYRRHNAPAHDIDILNGDLLLQSTVNISSGGVVIVNFAVAPDGSVYVLLYDTGTTVNTLRKYSPSFVSLIWEEVGTLVNPCSADPHGHMDVNTAGTILYYTSYTAGNHSNTLKEFDLVNRVNLAGTIVLANDSSARVKDIFAVRRDSSGNIWICAPSGIGVDTRGGSLYKYDDTDSLVFSQIDIVPYSVGIYTVGLAVQGSNIWVGTTQSNTTGFQVRLLSDGSLVDSAFGVDQANSDSMDFGVPLIGSCAIRTSDFFNIETSDGYLLATYGDCEGETKAGLYQMVLGKKHDTIYQTSGGTLTRNVKIP